MTGHFCKDCKHHARELPEGIGESIGDWEFCLARVNDEGGYGIVLEPMEHACDDFEANEGAR